MGGQSEWARRTGIDRTYICKVLGGRKPPGPSIYGALGLESVILRDHTKSHVSAQEVRRILQAEIENAGSISRWCRRTGINRSYLSQVLHKRKGLGKKILAALGLSNAVIYQNPDDISQVDKNDEVTTSQPVKGRTTPCF
jgi:hypothetical protein